MTTPVDIPAGSPIPGSRFIRAYCPCGEPLRVTSLSVRDDDGKLRTCYCEDCYPPITYDRSTTLTPRQRGKLGNSRGG